MRVKIKQLHKKDAHYRNRHDVIGLVGEVHVVLTRKGGWYGVFFRPDKNPWPLLKSSSTIEDGTICFAYCKFEKLPDAPAS